MSFSCCTHLSLRIKLYVTYLYLCVGAYVCGSVSRKLQIVLLINRETTLCGISTSNEASLTFLLASEKLSFLTNI